MAPGAGGCYIGGIVESPYRVEPEPESDPNQTENRTVPVRTWIPVEWKELLDSEVRETLVPIAAIMRRLIYAHLFPKNGGQG